jgi:prephenate dehydrogenase
VKDERIAIIGGSGQFGQHLGQELEEDNDIVISGKMIEEAREIGEKHGWEYGENKEIVRDADTVIIAVPIDVTVEVIDEIGPEISNDTLLTDITSVKKKPVRAMKKYSDEVVGMHPMYAPSNSIQGQKVVLTPEKGEKWRKMKDFWEDRGANIHITDPESHDKAMSVVQGIMHFSELVIAQTMMKNDLDPEDIECYSSPVYQMITDLTARMLNQDPELYGSIQKENPENENVREDFLESVEEIKSAVEDGGFNAKFKELEEQFDSQGAQKRTDELIEHLSNKVLGSD